MFMVLMTVIIAMLAKFGKNRVAPLMHPSSEVRNTPAGWHYGPLAVALHWVLALLIVFMGAIVLVLVLAVDLGLRHRRALAPIIAFAMGYAMDAFSGSQLGVNTFAVTLTYLLTYEVGVHFSVGGAEAGAVLVFIISLGYFITPMLLGGPRSMLIATMITQQATKFLDWPLAAALASILMAATLLIVVVFNRVLRLDRVMGSG